MMHCPQCGVENDAGARFCGACGAHVAGPPGAAEASGAGILLPAMRGMTPVATVQPETHFAAMRGMVAAAPSPAEPHHDGMRVMARERAAAATVPEGARLAEGKHATTAMVLSFLFPGGGQLYNGDWKKGASLLGLALLAYCLTVYAGAWFLGIPLSLGAWVWGMFDAAKVARREKALWV